MLQIKRFPSAAVQHHGEEVELATVELANSAANLTPYNEVIDSQNMVLRCQLSQAKQESAQVDDAVQLNLECSVQFRNKDRHLEFFAQQRRNDFTAKSFVDSF